MTLLCINNSQSPTHKGSLLQSGKSPVTPQQQNHHHHHHRRNSCSPPASTKDSGSRKPERSCSEDRKQQQQQQQQQGSSSRYKTELCRPYEESGICKYGDKCQFAHGVKELRNLARHPKYKTELCRTFHSTGLCPYGPRCHFIHNSEQNKKMNPVFGGSPVTRPKALSSLGSAGDMSPTSSHSGSPTRMKSFDDLFQQSPGMMSGGFAFPQDLASLVNQRFLDYSPREYDVYDSASVFGDPPVGEGIENFGGYHQQGGPVLDLYQTNPPSTPLDASASFFRLPIFDLFHRQ